MAFGSLSPVGIQQFMDANGNPLAGGKLYVYLAGTTTPTPAYADVNLTTPLANPVILDAAGRAPELFLAALAYKQVLKNSSDVTIWTADNIVTPTALRSVMSSSSITGTQNDVPVPAGIISFINFSNTTPLTITGFSGGTPGQLLILRAGQFAPIYLLPMDAGSVPANRLFNFVQSGPTTLVGPQGIAVYLYTSDGTNADWLLITHEQGGWLPVPYAAGNFTTENTPTGTWTVDAGDIGQVSTYLSGGTLYLTFDIRTSSVAGAPAQLRIANLPYSFRTAIFALPILMLDSSATLGTGYLPGAAGVIAGQRFLVVARPAGTWPALTNSLSVFGQINADVT